MRKRKRIWVSRLRLAPRAVAGALACFTALLSAATVTASAQSYSVVYSFQCGPNDGEYPYGDLIADTSGNLYGTTSQGGAFGGGTVYEISIAGTETVLHSFAGQPSDGLVPVAGLARDAAGNLYGTTAQGGAYGWGTVFKLAPDGTESILHSFQNNGKDGYYPRGNLLLDQAGNLYGTTTGGGADADGTVFKWSTDGELTLLHSFAGSPSDGEGPGAGLTRNSAANLYSTTGGGGADYHGTVFEVSKGKSETTLYSFEGSPDGADPAAGLVRDATGELYGTTQGGGQTKNCNVEVEGCGTVFQLTSNGTETVLYSFTGGTDGGVPFSDLVVDPKGNLYGTASQGGGSLNCLYGCGVVFEVTAAGKERVLHAFTNFEDGDGAAPYGGLLHKSDTFYGTTVNGGGPGGCGTVYKVTP